MRSNAANLLSHYRLVRRLGAGGMGEVFLAQDTRLDRSVALKVMSQELARDEIQRKRFRTEAKAASGLIHPNICVIHEVGETEDGRPFLAMEYVEGQTLDRILQQRRVRIRETIDIGIGVAQALQTAHARGVVHRDIKPANIMLDARGQVKVLDFGLAKRFGPEDLTLASTSASLTRTGMLIGTPHYMSPEQALGRELEPRTDLFSLGVVLYELVTGQKPFLGRTVGETINNVINQQPEPLGLENALYTPALDNIIFKCLQKDPDKRYASAKALADDLIALKNQSERSPGLAKHTPARRTGAAADEASEPTKLWQLAGRRRRSKLGLAVGFAAVVLILLGLGSALLRQYIGNNKSRNAANSTPARTIPRKSVAVLPFDDFSPEPDTEYLSDGLTEEITTALSRIAGLKVAARNSAFAFKGKKEDVRKIGELLRVSTILEGSIRKVGKQLRVTAQLINAADGFHLWSETYNRSVDDIIAVQEEIAERIAERLQTGAAPAQNQRKAVNPEAHQLYLQARVFWNKRTEASLKRAVQLFQESLERDPTYSKAHAGLAATYLLLPLYSAEASKKEFAPLARAAADRALQLDSSCAEAHTVLAELQSALGDTKGAEEHFRLALQLEPNYATAHHWYGRDLNLRGRWDEGFAELQLALSLDPLSPIIHATIPEWYYLKGDTDRALEEAQRVVETFPDFTRARELLVAVQIRKGLLKEALAEVDKMRASQPEEIMTQLLRLFVLARLGQDKEPREFLAALEQRRKEGKHVDGQMCLIYEGLGEYDKALDALERMFETDGYDDGVLLDPMHDQLRKLPRFQAIVEKARLKKPSP